MVPRSGGHPSLTRAQTSVIRATARQLLGEKSATETISEYKTGKPIRRALLRQDPSDEDWVLVGYGLYWKGIAFIQAKV